MWLGHSRLENKVFFAVLAVTLHMMIKSLKIILHWCLWHVIDNKTFHGINIWVNDLLVIQALKTNFIYWKRKHFTISISNFYPKSLRRERCLKWETLSLTCDQWKGEMVEYPTMGNALLYETKQIAVKWEN